MLLDKTTIRENYLHIIEKKWLEAPDTFPAFLPKVSREKQEQNEQYIQAVSSAFQNHMKCFPRKSKDRETWKKEMLLMLGKVLREEEIIGIHLSMDQKSIEAFVEELRDFLRHVRKFAPELSLEGIGQAIRNYIVYAMFVEIHQVSSGFSKAAFGYSMLYPFTDNYIDSPTNSDRDKAEYNHMIRTKIAGGQVRTKTAHQQKTCELLGMIESDYPRKSGSAIYMLLLMMLEAQEESLRQQNSAAELTPGERLEISIYKGGLSVLIDRFFVRKEITEEDLIFYLGFGFFLQLADDLQDIKDDSTKGHQTILTIDHHSDYEERVVNKLLHFVYQITKSYPAENDSYKYFILSNCCQLVYTSVTGSREYFSQEYLHDLENYLPVTYPFLENMKKSRLETKDSKIHDKYMKILDEMIS